jgi:hypothetical protein
MASSVNLGSTGTLNPDDSSSIGHGRRGPGLGVSPAVFWDGGLLG